MLTNRETRFEMHTYFDDKRQILRWLFGPAWVNPWWFVGDAKTKRPKGERHRSLKRWWMMMLTNRVLMLYFCRQMAILATLLKKNAPKITELVQRKPLNTRKIWCSNSGRQMMILGWTETDDAWRATRNLAPNDDDWPQFWNNTKLQTKWIDGTVLKIGKYTLTKTGQIDPNEDWDVKTENPTQENG